MAKTITTIKTIATLGKRELRYTEMDGVKKFDIRAWNGDKYEDGVRFTEDEIFDLRCVMSGEVKDTKVGNKDLIVTDNGEYALSITINGRTYVRPFLTHNEMNKLCEIFKATDNLLEYDENAKVEEEPKVEAPKKKRGRPKKNPADVEINKKMSTETEDLIKKHVDNSKEAKPKKVYKDAYEKFDDQFKEFRKSQPKEMRFGYEFVHQMILEHIKDIIATSDEYNKNAMQEWKNTQNMMIFCRKKMFERAKEYMEINTKDEEKEFVLQLVDEYIGTDDKPACYEAKTKDKSENEEKKE